MKKTLKNVAELFFAFGKAGLESFFAKVEEKAQREREQAIARKPLRVHRLHKNESSFYPKKWVISCCCCYGLTIVEKTEEAAFCGCGCGAFYDIKKELAFNRKPTSEEMEGLNK